MLDPDEYLAIFEAARHLALQLEGLSDELLTYGVDVEDLDKLRQGLDRPPVPILLRRLLMLDPDEYLTTFEAAMQLERLSDELLAYGVDVEDLEELRQLGRRFCRHLNGRESLYYILRDVAEKLLC